MTDIKPNTREYTKPADRYRALAAILDAANYDGEIEIFLNGSWVRHRVDGNIFQQEKYEYRIKPKPRELWAVYNGAGDYLAAFETEGEATAHCRLAIARSFRRFVEQPADGA